MSTSDSDCSIDWLASDDDSASPKTLSPQHEEEPLAPPSTSSSSLREATRRRRRRSGRCDCADSAAALRTPAASPVQGFTSVYTQQTLPVESKHRSTRKRTHGAGLDGFSEGPQSGPENEFFSQKVRGWFLSGRSIFLKMFLDKLWSVCGQQLLHRHALSNMAADSSDPLRPPLTHVNIRLLYKRCCFVLAFTLSLCPLQGCDEMF